MSCAFVSAIKNLRELEKKQKVLNEANIYLQSIVGNKTRKCLLLFGSDEADSVQIKTYIYNY